MFVCVCACLYMYLCQCMCAYVSVCVYDPCILARVCVCVCLCVCRHMYTCVHSCTHVLCLCMFLCLYCSPILVVASAISKDIFLNLNIHNLNGNVIQCLIYSKEYFTYHMYTLKPLHRFSPPFSCYFCC